MNFFNSKTPLKGFLYVEDEEDGVLKNIQEGITIKNPTRNPPWIVVDHSIRNILVTNWPGTLWEVEILDPKQYNDLNADLIANASYTRTTEINVIKQLPVSALFDPHGNFMCALLDAARNLDQNQVTYLSSLKDPGSSPIYSETWNKWLKSVEVDSIHLGDDHSNTLIIFTADSKSPTGNNIISTISTIVDKRARQLLGAKALVIDEEGEVSLTPIWGKACSTLLHAAMAIGAAQFLSEEEIKILLHPWNSFNNHKKV